MDFPFDRPFFFFFCRICLPTLINLIIFLNVVVSVAQKLGVEPSQAPEQTGIEQTGIHHTVISNSSDKSSIGSLNNPLSRLHGPFRQLSRSQSHAAAPSVLILRCLPSPCISSTTMLTCPIMPATLTAFYAFRRAYQPVSRKQISQAERRNRLRRQTRSTDFHFDLNRNCGGVYVVTNLFDK